MEARVTRVVAMVKLIAVETKDGVSHCINVSLPRRRVLLVSTGMD